MKPDYSSFGQLVKQRREALDLTQAELAQQLGYAVDTISSLETGRRRPSKQLITLLARVLEIPTALHPTFFRLARGGEDNLPSFDLPVAAPRAAAARSPSLPAFLTPFRGREVELQQIDDLIRNANKRMVTLTGLGGIGKTRLAVQAATQLQGYFPDGVIFVDLATIQEPTLIVPVILHTLGQDATAVKNPGELAVYLQDKQILLVLDNCEQLRDAGPILRALLAGASRLTLLITSRVILRLAGEQVVPIAPLPLPPEDATVADLADYTVVQLFVERVREVLGEFSLTPDNARLVSGICCKLEGIPLAIELAVAWVRLLPLDTLLHRLERRLEVLDAAQTDLPTHQAGLRAALDWSYELLPAAEQDVFARLGVFAGSWTVEAAEALLGRSLLHSLRVLVESNLIGHAPGPQEEVRCTMLGIVREYALHQLEAGNLLRPLIRDADPQSWGGYQPSAPSEDAQALRGAHAHYYRQWAETARPQLNGPQASYWLDQVEMEHDNVRAALNWLLEHEEYEAAGQLSSALAKFWTERNHIAEGRRWLMAALGRGPGTGAIWTRTLTIGGLLAQYEGDYEVAQAQYEASLALSREIHDTQELGRTLRLLGEISLARGNYSQAMACYEESLAASRAVGNLRGVALVRMDQIRLAQLQGNPMPLPQVQQYHEESLAIFRAQGDQGAQATTLIYLADILIQQGAYAQAVPLLEESRDLYRQLKSYRRMVNTLIYLGAAMVGLAQYRQAMQYYLEALEGMRKVEDILTLAECLDGISECIAPLGETQRAIYLMSFTTAVRQQQRTYLEPHRMAAQIHLLATLRSQVGADAFATAWQTGEQAAVDTVLAEVLDLGQHIVSSAE